MISKHFSKTLCQIMHLYSRTPIQAIHILAGVPQAEAIIDMKIFSLLSMFSRLGQNNYLYNICLYLLHIQSSSSWVMYTRTLAVKYSLPDPLLILTNPPEKHSYKKLVRSKILHFWHSKLLNEMEAKSSLTFLKASFLPLGSGPHPLWLSCEGSKTANEAAIIQASILSGRYRDDYLISKFNRVSSGSCSMCGAYPGTVTHYLSGECVALLLPLQRCLDHSLDVLFSFPYLLPPVTLALHSTAKDWVGLVVDPGTNHKVIRIKQMYGHESIWPLYRFSRALIMCMHRERMRLLQ